MSARVILAATGVVVLLLGIIRWQGLQAERSKARLAAHEATIQALLVSGRAAEQAVASREKGRREISKNLQQEVVRLETAKSDETVRRWTDGLLPADIVGLLEADGAGAGVSGSSGGSPGGDAGTGIFRTNQ